MEQAIWTWISPVWKGKSFGPNLHDFGCKMLIFQPVFPKYYSQHLTLSASNVGSVGCKKTWENNLACKRRHMERCFLCQWWQYAWKLNMSSWKRRFRNLLFSHYLSTIFSFSHVLPPQWRATFYHGKCRRPSYTPPSKWGRSEVYLLPTCVAGGKSFTQIFNGEIVAVWGKTWKDQCVS